jgi:PAS domain S-box-containing protein
LPADERAEEIIAGSALPLPLPCGGPRRRVLVADDNADMRAYLARLLAPHWDVETVADGLAALEAATRRAPDLVLCDVMMPGVDGFGVLRALRADPATRDIPVILLSARAGEEARVEGLGAGADDYLIKPFNARELVARIGNQLQLARLRREGEAKLRASEERFRTMADNAPVMVWVTGPDGACTYLSKRWGEFTGQTADEGLGFGWLDCVHPDDRERAREAFLAASVRHEPFRLDYRVRRHDGEWRWAIDAAAPWFAPDGAFLGFIGSVIDITDRKRDEERLKLLAAEVDHRSKNMLTVVQALVRLTRAATVEDFADAVTGRINALARAHTLLAQGRWDGADLGRLIDEELAPYASASGARVQVDGPKVALSPDAAQSAAMMIHELATNAAKHGALSTPAGRLNVAWSWTPDGSVALDWIETGGPAATEPSRRGMGSNVIERTITQQLGGTMRLDWRPVGLRCEIVLPAAAVVRFAV